MRKMKHYIVYSVPITRDDRGEWSFESAIRESTQNMEKFPYTLKALRGFTIHPNRYQANQHIRKTSKLPRYAVRMDYSHQIDPDEIIRTYPALKTEISREIYVGKVRPWDTRRTRKYTKLEEIWVLEVHSVLTMKRHIQEFIQSLVERATFVTELMTQFLIYDQLKGTSGVIHGKIWEGQDT